MTFQLDTSGAVRLRGQYPNGQTHDVTFFSDLPAFTQGYVEAALRAFMSRTGGPTSVDPANGTRHLAHVFRFADLAPETLSAIMADCEAFAGRGDICTYAESGAEFWKLRQSGAFPHFPPLAFTIDIDGTLRLEERR